MDYRIRVREASPNGLIYVLGYDLGNVREGAGRILSVSLIITGILVVLFSYQPDLHGYFIQTCKEPEGLCLPGDGERRAGAG